MAQEKYPSQSCQQQSLYLKVTKAVKQARCKEYWLVLIVLIVLSIPSFVPWAPPTPQALARAADAGAISGLKKKVAPWATHWATVTGRITLRQTAAKATRAGMEIYYTRKGAYLSREWKVPINDIPADERRNDQVKVRETPLVAAVMAGKENVALHLLSFVQSEQDRDLRRRLDRGNTLLHHAAWKGQTESCSRM